MQPFAPRLPLRALASSAQDFGKTSAPKPAEETLLLVLLPALRKLLPW
jgi:hypothetical protein